MIYSERFLYFFMVLLVLGCAKKNEGSESQVADLPLGNQYNFNYQYPKDLFRGLGFNGESLEFYLIGFSKFGRFAYLNRSCDGSCGCCKHEIIVTDLLSDAVIDRMQIAMGGDRKEDAFQSDWENQFQQITAFLRKHSISQVQLSMDNQSRFIFNGRSYEVMVQSKTIPNANPGSIHELVRYAVRVKLDDARVKVVNKGDFYNGENLTYLGFIKSPYDDQLALLFNKQYYGMNHDYFSEIVVIGCHLSPKYWGVPGY